MDRMSWGLKGEGCRIIRRIGELDIHLSIFLGMSFHKVSFRKLLETSYFYLFRSSTALCIRVTSSVEGNRLLQEGNKWKHRSFPMSKVCFHLEHHLLSIEKARWWLRPRENKGIILLSPFFHFRPRGIRETMEYSSHNMMVMRFKCNTHKYWILEKSLYSEVPMPEIMVDNGGRTSLK